MGIKKGQKVKTYLYSEFEKKNQIKIAKGCKLKKKRRNQIKIAKGCKLKKKRRNQIKIARGV